VAIAPGQLLDDRRVDLFAVEPDVDRVLVVEHAHLRLFGRLAAVERRLLRERVGGRRGQPDRVVQASVDERRLRRVDGRDVRHRSRLGLVNRPREQSSGEEGKEEQGSAPEPRYRDRTSPANSWYREGFWPGPDRERVEAIAVAPQGAVS